jgi:RNA polymerase sigma factor (sigma-70 family)
MTALFARKLDRDRSFERLYEAHVQDVYRYALMVLRNPDDAEDVVQTTFLKAYRAIGGGERPRNARAWLITIAHNTCLTRARDAKRRPQEVAFEEQVAQSVDAQDEDGVNPRELIKAFGGLSFNQRSALLMRELEGRSYAEIAQLLEVSPSAVETLLFRARRALREQLEGTLSCGEAEEALSRDLDGRLAPPEKAELRAHLRSCAECASLARRQRARRAALRGLGPLPLPGSLTTWGGGAAAGAGVAAKVAAIVTAGAAAAGVGYEAADAVSRPQALEAARVAAVGTPLAPAAAEAFSALKLIGASPSTPATRGRTIIEALAENAEVAAPLAEALVWAAPAAATPAMSGSEPTAEAGLAPGATGSSLAESVAAAVTSAPKPGDIVRTATAPLPSLPVAVPQAPTVAAPQLPAAPTVSTPTVSAPAVPPPPTVSAPSLPPPPSVSAPTVPPPPTVATPTLPLPPPPTVTVPDGILP